MMNGIYDEVIPRKYTIELWEALGRPKIKWYPCAHVNIVFIMKRVVGDMIKLFRKRFKFKCLIILFVQIVDQRYR